MFQGVVFTLSVVAMPLLMEFLNGRGYCARPGDSAWYTAYAASVAADVGPDIIAAGNAAVIPGSVGNELAHELANMAGEAGLASATSEFQNRPNQAYLMLNPEIIDQEQLQEVIETNIAGIMCGTYAKGICHGRDAALYPDCASPNNFEDSEKLGWLGDLPLMMDSDPDNDGMVTFRSCGVGGKAFTTNLQSPYYRTASNHVDGTCRTGNIPDDVAKQPCSWYARATGSSRPPPPPGTPTRRGGTCR
eukprot:SAG11_NODE_674_length_7801_cov_3.578032_5_plen_247_part_00